MHGNRSVKVEGAESCSMIGNEFLLRRAIENVVRNAVHYTAEQTDVKISVCSPGAEPNEKAFEISVRDHGPGVPDEVLTEIFRPFYRVDEARDREAGGVGLGLAIAERAVNLHGGTMKAGNAAGGGLLVTINLPIIRLSA